MRLAAVQLSPVQPLTVQPREATAAVLLRSPLLRLAA
jgi:hypothetical protein